MQKLSHYNFGFNNNGDYIVSIILGILEYN